MGTAASSSGCDEVPVFMLCDGAFHLEPGSELASRLVWCGWLRFEGHGLGSAKQRDADGPDVAEVRGSWSVADAHTVRFECPREVLLLREGPRVDTLRVSIEGEPTAGSAVYTFVPEDPEEHLTVHPDEHR